MKKRTDDEFPSHPAKPYNFDVTRIDEAQITEEGVQQYTGPLFRVSVSETDTQGTCTVQITSDAALRIDASAPITFEQDGTPHAPTTHPLVGYIGVFTFTFAKDPKHPILIAPVILCRDGTEIRPGTETFDFDTASNVINVMLADKTSTVVTATVQFDTDTKLGAATGRYKIGASSYVTFAIVGSPLDTGVFDITLASGQQTVAIGGQNLAGVWGPEVVITVGAGDAAGGPSLDVKVVHASPTAGESTITWAGSGTLVSINGATATTPGTSPWVVTRPLAGVAADAYTFIGARNGQTVQDTIFIPAMDQDTVTPDVSLSVTSSTSTTITYSMVVTNPAGGAAAYVTVYAYYCSLTFNGSTYTNTSVGGSFGTGTPYPIVVTKPTSGNLTYSGATATLRVRAIISGGGGEEVSRTIPDQTAGGFTAPVFSSLSQGSVNYTANTIVFGWAYGGSGSATFNVYVRETYVGPYFQIVTTTGAGATSYTYTAQNDIVNTGSHGTETIEFYLEAVLSSTVEAKSKTHIATYMLGLL